MREVDHALKTIVWHCLTGIAIVAGLYLCSQFNYLLFHSLVEMFSVIVAIGIFIVTWHTRRLAGSSYLILLGFAYMSVGALDFLHTLSYKGMGVFPYATANLPTQLWIQARYVEAFSLLLAPLLIRRKIHVSIPLLGYVCVTLCLLGIIFATDLFPACYAEGEGLTPFKKASEYVICLVLLVAAALHYLKRRDLDTSFLRLMLSSIMLTVMAEFAFTRYFNVYGPANIVGHLLKVGSFVLIYRAVVIIGLAKPQKALAESDERFRAFIRNSIDAIWCIEIDPPISLDLPEDEQIDYLYKHARVVEANDVSARQAGLDRGEDMVGMHLDDFMPLSLPENLAAFQSAVRYSYNLIDFKTHDAAKDDEPRFFLNNMAGIIKDGHVGQVWWTARDITGQEVAREKLHQAEQKYRTVFENAKEAIFVTQDETVQHYNAQALEMIGYSEDEIHSMPFIEFIHPEDRSRVLEEYQGQLSGGKTSASYQIRMIAKSGHVKWVMANSALIDWEGRPASLTILADITELKATKKKLGEAEQKYRTIADFNYDWEYWEGPDGDLLYVSPSCERITGYTEDEFLNKPGLLTDIVTSEDKHILDSHRHEYPEVKALRDIQFRIRKKDGTIRWIEHVCRPVKNEKGIFTGFRASNRDITDRKFEQNELLHLRSELIHATRVSVMGELTAALAHELSQPLTAIKSNAQAAQRFLKEEKPDLNELREILVDIVSDDNRAKEIILKLRSLLRKTEQKFDKLDINRIIVEVIPLLHSESVIKNIIMETRLDSDLPFIRGDRIQLQQVLINLILNSFEAMRDTDFKKLCVSTTLSDSDAVTVSIRDSGSGVDEKNAEDIFRPFVTTKAEGMGMGLAISRSIIEAHGGKIWVKNNPDHGATFYVTMPVFKGSLL